MNALRLYREWDERRRLKWAGWWERKRARGRNHYVRWVTLLWGATTLNVSILWDCLYGGGFSFIQFLIMIPLCFAGGRLFGAVVWSSNESRYRKHLAGGRVQELRQ